MANVATILKQVKELSPTDQRKLATKLTALVLVKGRAASAGARRRSYSKLRALAGTGVSNYRDVSTRTDDHLAEIYTGTRRSG